jgi:hypothetical protein
MPELVIKDHHRNALAETKACLYCGAPAAVLKYRKFAWCPQWVYLLLLVGVIPCAIIAFILTKRKGLNVPLCAAHKHHWLWRNVIGVGGLVVVIGFFIGGIAMMDPQPGAGRGNSDIGALFFLAALLSLVLWLIALIVGQFTAIRPAKITNDSITLQRVSRKFIEVYRRPRPELAQPVAADVGDHWAPGKSAGTNIATGTFQPGPDDVVDLPPDAIQERP